MADNVAITAGSGTIIAADEIVDGTLGTVKVQYTKLMDGTLGGGNKAVVSSTGALSVSNLDSASQAQYNFPAGFVRVSDEPRQVFYDPFDTTLDITNTWNTPTVGNSATIATNTAGVLTMGTGTTASGWSKLTSQSTFRLPIPAWMGFSFAITLVDGAAPIANSYRFWGSGTIPTTPTTAAPLTDAVGFEMTTAGALIAVVWVAGVRTVIQDLSTSGNSTQPLDASSHRYIVYVRTDKTYWYIDNLITPVATSNFQGPSVQSLPITMLAVGFSTPPGSNAQIKCNGAAVWDTGKNATQISDGLFPWRKATVSSTGALSVLATQPTGSNLHVVTDSGTITTVSTVTAVTTITNAVQVAPSTTGGLSAISFISAATTNATVVKASAGQLYSIQAFNLNATLPRYLKFYNTSTSPTVGTTTIVASFLIPPTSGGFVIDIPFGMTFSTGISCAVVNGILANDATAILASEVLINIQYK